MQNRYVLTDSQVEKLEKIGKIIKNRRAELSYPLEQVAEITRISVTNLRAIEQASYNDFPNPVFIKGFLRSYCRFLEIDSDWMIEDINEIFSINPQNQHTKGTNGVHQLTEKTSNNLSIIVKSALASFIFISLLVVSYFGFRYFSQGDFYKPVISAKIQEQKELDASKPFGILENSAILPPQDLEVVLTGKAEGWISVSIDNAKSELFKISSGETKVWHAENSVYVKLGRGDLAILRINGEEEKIPQSANDRIYEFTFSK